MLRLPSRSLIILWLMSGAVAANAAPIVETDKAAHFSVAAVSTMTLMRMGQLTNAKHKITLTNRLVSSLIVASAGYAKEVQDRRIKNDDQLDRGDLNADAAGIVFGNILMIEF